MKNIFLITILIFTFYGLSPAEGEAPPCLRIEGMSFCPPDLSPPPSSSGNAGCSPCYFCDGDGGGPPKTMIVATSTQSCRACVCGVDCPPGPGGEGCGYKEICTPGDCNLQSMACSTGKIGLPAISDGNGTCKCPDAPPGMGSCGGPTCQPDQTCN